MQHRQSDILYVSGDWEWLYTTFPVCSRKVLLIAKVSSALDQHSSQRLEREPRQPTPTKYHRSTTLNSRIHRALSAPGRAKWSWPRPPLSRLIAQMLQLPNRVGAHIFHLWPWPDWAFKRVRSLAASSSGISCFRFASSFKRFTRKGT